MKKLVTILTVILALSACGKGHDSSKKNQTKQKKKVEVSAKTIRVAEISKGTVYKNDTSGGIIDPINEVLEMTETGGDVVKVHYKNGDRVKKGQVIIELKNKKIKTAYLTAKADLISIESAYKTKEINYKKFKKLYNEKLISEDEYLTIKNSFTQISGNLEISKAKYDSAKEDYQNLTVKSKISGVVTDLDIKEYAKLRANTNLFTIVDDSSMKIKTSVSNTEIGTLKVGAVATVTPEGVETAYNGKVSEINPVANPQTKKFPVNVVLDNKEKNLKKGMYATISIRTGSREGYVVPAESIVIKALYSYIFIEKDNKVKRIAVLRGYSNGDKIEVLSKELDAYKDKSFNVVVEGQFLLNDADKVKIIK